ncbi:hypothetical protein BCV71DRAFT_272308 [Rhizopus microsporus]|uniref:Uncharacterized protein n=2 Tax=Rhizopus TaxID=4842 RepID=A0A1X0RVW2_RHIZD|nr:hypothetical protein BCV71DRAFT_272308 [Rhizopus microsporus]
MPTVKQLRAELAAAKAEITRLLWSSLHWRSPPFQKASKFKDPTSLPSQMADARTFNVPSVDHGYKFLYLPLRRRLPIDQLRSRLRQLNSVYNHDPLDPLNLRNPDYDDWNEASRTITARGLFLCRILHALDYLKGPVKQSVASFFANKGYIDCGDFPELFSVKKTSYYCSLNGLPF